MRQKSDVRRINVNISAQVKQKLDDYAVEHYMSQAAAVNQILEQFFNGQEAIQSMGNLATLMQVFAKQTGIDLSSLCESGEARQSEDALASLQTRG